MYFIGLSASPLRLFYLYFMLVSILDFNVPTARAIDPLTTLGRAGSQSKHPGPLCPRGDDVELRSVSQAIYSTNETALWCTRSIA